ncbi:MAG: cytochrome P450 [Actinomycetota bacterium]
MVTPVTELELPVIDGADRGERREQADAARATHWLAKAPMGYVLTRYEDCVKILRDARWHSALAVLNRTRGIDDPRMVERQRPSILSTEGAEHLRIRKLVGPAFTPKQAEGMRPLMRDVVNELVDPVAEAGRCEFVADICEPYPIPIICAMVGAPREDWQTFSRLATSIFRFFDDDAKDHVDEIVAARIEIDEYVTALIEERRAEPRDDLLTDLIRAEEEGDRLSTSELLSLVEALILAGTDTTRNQLACAIALFARYPGQWELLRERPELAPRAVEETMRHLGAVRGTGRFAAEDVEYRDIAFPAGTLVFPSFTSANHDPGVFDEAETFDITAERGKAQLTFGSGIHFCLGASLARAELQEALTILARRMPDLELDGEIVWKPDGTGIWGPAELPIRFTPGH